MTDLPASRPDGARLQADLKSLTESLIDFQDALFGVNDEQLLDAFRLPLDVGSRFVALHAQRATSSIADDAANLRSIFARHYVAREHPDLGPLETLKKVRSARGALLADIDDVLQAAAEMGLRPRSESFQAPAVAELDRAGLANLLMGLGRRLGRVESALDEIRPEGTDAPGRTPQQIGLVNFFIDNVGVEVALAKLEIKGPSSVDLASLTRSIETMADLTRNFIATVRAMRDKLTQKLRSAAESFRPLVRRVARGLLAMVYRVHRNAPRVVQSKSPEMHLPTTVSDKSTASLELIELIQSVFLCSEDIAGEFAKLGTIDHYQEGTTILKHGETVLEFFLVIAGRADALIYPIEGSPTVLEEYGRGDFFGALAEVDPPTSEVQIEATRYLEALRVETAALAKFAGRHGAIGLGFSRLLLNRLRRTSARIYERSAISAVGRVHAELLRLARQRADFTVQPPPVIAELAVRVSTTRETASRAISALERRGIVHRSRDGLVILKPNRLEELII